MATTLKCSLGIALSLLAATSTSAADPLPLPRAALTPITPGGYGYGYGYLTGAGSTAHESINRGAATFIRSVGERHLLDAEARRSHEEANARRLDNVLKAAQTRIAMRRMGEAEQQLRFEKIHARRMTTMAINDAHKMLKYSNNPAANVETRAEARLRLARALLENGREETAINWLKELTSEYANTPAAAEAARMLADLNA